MNSKTIIEKARSLGASLEGLPTQLHWRIHLLTRFPGKLNGQQKPNQSWSWLWNVKKMIRNWIGGVSRGGPGETKALKKFLW